MASDPRTTLASRLNTKTAAAIEILSRPSDHDRPPRAAGHSSRRDAGDSGVGLGLALAARGRLEGRRALEARQLDARLGRRHCYWSGPPGAQRVRDRTADRAPHPPEGDVSEFRPLIGNLKLALLYLGLVWTWAAFGEELAYRGYVLNRAADLGGRTSLAWAASLLFVTGLFGFGHSYQGLAGMIDTASTA
jgi:hypothetical protein